VLGTPGSRDQYTPLQVPGLSGAVVIAAGYRHNLVLKSDGTVWAWGGNFSDHLGSAGAVVTSPIQLNALTNVDMIASCYWHSLVRKTDGSVWAWGNRSYGHDQFTQSPATWRRTRRVAGRCRGTS
jgi:alpha-tubulin suppressor-like RCC1 family protein